LLKLSLSIVAASLCALGLLAAAGGSAVAGQGSERPELEQFQVFDESSSVRIEYGFLHDYLAGVVLDVGRSDRRPARTPDARTGSRIQFASTSRYRYENNRVVFHLISDDRIQALSSYRAELESLPDRIPLQSLNRNEQLAFWLNLHNVVVLDELARAYPVRRPDRLRPLDNGVSLHDARIIRINGVDLSPNDIRFHIVQAGWDDPRIIYGFYSGAVGGPALQDRAFTGASVWRQLDSNAREFVNALRGVEKLNGRTRTRVSPLYEEHQALFGNWPGDLLAHLQQHATPMTRADITPGPVQFLRFDHRIADLTNGLNACRASSNIAGAGFTISAGGDGVARTAAACDPIPPMAADLLNVVIERRIENLRAGRTGSVTVRDIYSPDPDDIDEEEDAPASDPDAPSR